MIDCDALLAGQLDRVRAIFGSDLPTSHAHALQALEIEGELAFRLCHMPELLVLSRSANLSAPACPGSRVTSFGLPPLRIWLLAAAGETSNWSGEPVDRAGETGRVVTRTGAWWCARAVVAHRRLLVSRQAPERLWAEAVRLFEAALLRFGRRGTHVENGSLAAQVWLEWGLAQMHFDRPSGVRVRGRVPLQVGVASDFVPRLRPAAPPPPPRRPTNKTTVRASRTRFRPLASRQPCGLSGQAHQIPNSQPPSTGRRRQARSAEPPASDSGEAPSPAARCSGADEGDRSSAAVATCSQDEVDGATIRTAHHPEDGILLEQISFEDVEGQNNLHPIDQARSQQHPDRARPPPHPPPNLNTWRVPCPREGHSARQCLDVQNTNPKDGLTAEQMKPYIARVLAHPNNWMVYSTALFQRARLEFTSRHSFDRALLQASKRRAHMPPQRSPLTRVPFHTNLRCRPWSTSTPTG